MTKEIPIWITLFILFISGLTTYYLRNYYILFLSTLSLAIVFAGFSAAQLRTTYLQTITLKQTIGPTQIQGRIASLKHANGSMKLILDQVSFPNIAKNTLPTSVRLHVKSANPDLKPGQTIETLAVLKPVPQPTSPDSFDFQRHLYFQGIGAVGFNLSNVVILKNESHRISHFFDLLRLSIQGRIQQTLSHTGQEDQKNFAIAFLTGERQAIDEDIYEKVRDAGLAHLLAISGLHIGLITALTFFILRFLLAAIPIINLRFPIKKWAALGAIFSALFFTLLTGASIPTIRAFIMVSIVLTGVLLDRKAISLRTVAWAAIVILILFPESLVGASFQLSFAAVTALVAYYEFYERRLTHSHPTITYIRGVLSSSLITSLATMPYAAFHFNRIALYGLGANLLAIPLTVFWIMPFGLLGLFLMPLGLEGLGLVPMGWGISALLWVAEFTANQPFAHLSLSSMSTTSLVVITLAGLLFCLLPRPAKLFGLPFLLLGVFLAFSTDLPQLLISSDGRLQALQTAESKITVSNMRRSSYTRENWIRSWGQEDDTASPFHDEFSCDQQACVIDLPSNKRLIINNDAVGLREDCNHADILVALNANPSDCNQPSTIISNTDLKTEGAHALFFSPDGAATIRTTREVRGVRPWTVYGN